MTTSEQITVNLKTMSDDDLRAFVNAVEPWCKEVRKALNQKSNDLRRAEASRKTDGSPLSDGTIQEIMDAQTVVFLGIEGGSGDRGLLGSFPIIEVQEENETV